MSEIGHPQRKEVSVPKRPAVRPAPQEPATPTPAPVREPVKVPA